jgi:hypothetical protein
MSEEQSTIEAAFLLPAAQAVTSGVLAAGSAWTAAIVWNWSHPVETAVLVFMGVTFLSWLVFRSQWRRSLDVILGVILPEEPAAPEIYQAVTRVQVVSTDHTGAFIKAVNCEFSLEEDLLQQAAKRVQDTGSFSHASLSGPGKPLTRNEFEAMRDEFISRGLAYWAHPRSHNRGVALTVAGKRTIARLANPNPPTTEGGPKLTKI